MWACQFEGRWAGGPRRRISIGLRTPVHGITMQGPWVHCTGSKARPRDYNAGSTGSLCRGHAGPKGPLQQSISAQGWINFGLDFVFCGGCLADHSSYFHLVSSGDLVSSLISGHLQLRSRSRWVIFSSSHLVLLVSSLWTVGAFALVFVFPQ